MLDFLGKPEAVILLIVVLLLFGAKRLPDSARALGRSMRIFKAETKGLHSDDDNGKDKHDKDERAGQAAVAETIVPPTALPGVPASPVVPVAQAQHSEHRAS